MINNKKIALVLSGGGAMGAYEAGVFKALKKLHIKIDIVTGTSVGALNAIMVVQGDLKKCLQIWSNISASDIYASDIDLNQNKAEIYLEYAKEFISNKGMNPLMLERLVHSVYNAKKFYTSPIDFGLITFNLSNLKAECLTKEDISPDKLVDYTIASATCFPAFKIKEIENEKYIDGGYYDNMPINMAMNMGATDVIAVDLKAIGIKQKIPKDLSNLTIITPNNKLMNMLEFDSKKTKRAIKLGYNDTMKKYKILDGKFFTFKRYNLQRNYDKNINSFHNLLKDCNISGIPAFVAGKYKKIIECETSLNDFNTIVENCGKILELKDDIIYNVNKFNKILRDEITRLDIMDYKKLLTLKKSENKKGVVKTIYTIFDKLSKKEKLTLVSLFPKEFFCAVYLKTII